MPIIVPDPYREPTPTHVPTVESVLRKLGPCNLQRATRALPEDPGHASHSWHGCFWAHLYGAPGELVKASETKDKSLHQVVCEKYGVTRREFELMYRTFDNEYYNFRSKVLDYLAQYDLKAFEASAECDRAIMQLFKQVDKEMLEGVAWEDTSAPAAPEPNESVAEVWR